MFDGASEAIRREWPTVALGELIASLQAGVSVNSENRPCEEGEIGVLKTSCVSGGRFNPGEHKAVLENERERVRIPVEGNSIILSRMNTPDLVGENAYIEADQTRLFLPDRLWLLKTNTDADCRWLSFYMQSARFRRQIDDIATGTSGSMKNISKGRLRDLQVSLPSVDEQLRIVEVLASVDRVIALNAQISGYVANGGGTLRELKRRLVSDLMSGRVRVPA
jgi:type I restriction enzyme S subunit